MRPTTLALILGTTVQAFIVPSRPALRVAQKCVRIDMSGTLNERIAKIELAIESLKDNGASADALAPLEAQLLEMKQDAPTPSVPSKARASVPQSTPSPPPPPPQVPGRPPDWFTGGRTMWSAFETLGQFGKVVEAPFKAFNEVVSRAAADAEERNVQRREAAARAAAEAERLRLEEEGLTPQERATRELVRAFEGSDVTRLSKAIDAGQAAGLDSAALLPAIERLAEMEAALDLEQAEYELYMATRRATVGGKAEAMQLPSFVEKAAAAGVTGGSLQTACEYLDKKKLGDQVSARARAAAVAPDTRQDTRYAPTPKYARSSFTSLEAQANAERLLEERRAAQAAAAALETAASQAAAAAKAATAREQAERTRVENEMSEARELLRKSISLPGPKRTKLLRELQVKWHPDRFDGDPMFEDRALELSMKVNEAMKVARENAKARGEL